MNRRDVPSRAIPRAVPCPIPCVMLACAALACSLTGCHRERTPVQRGASVFARSCAGCHGPEGRGGAGLTGYTTPPRDLTDPALQARLGDEALRETIRHGKGQMPAFGANLGEDEVKDLIAFVRTLDKSR